MPAMDIIRTIATSIHPGGVHPEGADIPVTRQCMWCVSAVDLAQQIAGAIAKVHGPEITLLIGGDTLNTDLPDIIRDYRNLCQVEPGCGRLPYALVQHAPDQWVSTCKAHYSRYAVTYPYLQPICHPCASDLPFPKVPRPNVDHPDVPWRGAGPLQCCICTVLTLDPVFIGINDPTSLPFPVEYRKDPS